MASQPVGRKRKVPLELCTTDFGEDSMDSLSIRCFSQRERLDDDIQEVDMPIITYSLDMFENPAELLLHDRFAPKIPADLAVHSAKVKELKTWLEQATMRRDCLILTGPPGSAKSTAVRVLCQSLKITLQEWDYEDTYYEDTTNNRLFQENEMNQFLKFIRSRNCMNDNPLIKLIEYLPTAAYNDTSNFREKMRNAIRCSAHSLIFCLSDVKSCFDVSPQKIFSSRFVAEERYSSLAFNPVAKTISYKALKRARDLMGKKKKISDAKLNTIAELGEGDLRLCFNTLQFSLNVDGNLTEVDGSLQSVLCDNMYHMIGRILHAHRDPKFSELRPSWLPEDLHRPPPEHDINSILEMSTVDPNDLVSYFHEYAPKFSPSLKSTAKILEVLSFTDSLTKRWDVRLKIRDKNFNGLDEYQAQISTRAVYFHNHNAPKNTCMCSFKRPKSKELEREIRYLSQEFHNGINLCQMGFNTAVQQLAMFSNMRVSVYKNQYDLITYISRPFTWFWSLGRHIWNSNMRQTQARNETTGHAIVISETASAFPELNSPREIEENIDEDNVVIEDSEEEKDHDSFDEDPFE